MRGSHMAAWQQRLGSAIAGPRAEMGMCALLQLSDTTLPRASSASGCRLSGLPLIHLSIYWVNERSTVYGN